MGEQGLCHPKPGAEVSDIINALGRRLGDFPPEEPKLQMAALPPGQPEASEADKFKVGDEVVLQGLKTAKLNGQVGTVIRATGAVGAGRLPVRLVASGEKILVKGENMDVAPTRSKGEVANASDEQLAGGTAWQFSEEKMSAGRRKEEQIKDELWKQFLPGDDMPVGDDGLPPPAQYHGGKLRT